MIIEKTPLLLFAGGFSQQEREHGTESLAELSCCLGLLMQKERERCGEGSCETLTAQFSGGGKTLGSASEVHLHVSSGAHAVIQSCLQYELQLNDRP